MFQNIQKTTSKKLSNYFKLDDKKTTIKKELIGGLTTFVAMMYIIAVQPAMMNTSNVGLPYGGVFLSTIISSFLATFLMGLFANVPISLAPGMGINAFFAYTVCGILDIPVDQALSVVLISGWLYFFLAVSPFRKYISQAFPKNLKLAIGVGVGIFIGFVGLQVTGIIQSDAFTPVEGVVVAPTSVKLGNFKNPLVLLSLLVFFTMIVLYFLKVKGAIIISIILGVIFMSIMYATGIDVLQGKANPFKFNDFSDQFSEFESIAGLSYKNIFSALANPLCYIAIFVFLYTDFFDTTGTLFVLDESAKFSELDKKQVWLKRANIVDALGTIFGASLGSTTVTSYVESQSGISEGAKSGLASVFTASLFLFTIFLFPIMGPLMPISNTFEQAGVLKTELQPITGPVLILIGILMMMQLKSFNWNKTIDIPTLFMTIIIMPLTYSISFGISAGIITYVILKFSVAIKQVISDKYNKRPFKLSNYNKIFLDSDQEIDNYKWINIIMVILFIASMVYFGTTVLYFGY